MAKKQSRGPSKRARTTSTATKRKRIPGTGKAPKKKGAVERIVKRLTPRALRNTKRPHRFSEEGERAYDAKLGYKIAKERPELGPYLGLTPKAVKKKAKRPKV